MNARTGILMTFALICTLLLSQQAWADIDPVKVQKILAGDGAAADKFGWSVSVSGNTALIGMPYENWTGSVYVFVRSPSGMDWIQQAKITALDGATGDYFGKSVSLDGDTALIGAMGDSDKGDGSGSAYVFVRSGSSWTQQAKITADDGAAEHFFGCSVSINGGTALIGAQADDERGGWAGAAYVFIRTGTSWTQQAKFAANDTRDGDQFGCSVSLDGDTAVIGAIGDDENAAGSSGSVYVFVRSETEWTQQQKLISSDGAEEDLFGYSVLVNGDTALIGAPFDDDKGTDSGSAYVFVRSGATWTQQHKFTAVDGADGDQFGSSVSVDGNTALIGAPFDDDKGTDSGSAYVFVRSGATWTQQHKFTAVDGADGDQFGSSVSVDGNTALIGAPFDDDKGTDSGSAYITPGKIPEKKINAMPWLYLLIGK